MKNIEEVTGDKIKDLRKKIKMPQHQFWPAIGVSQPTGCRYESELCNQIPEPIRILLFARYVVGLPVENTPEGVEGMLKLAKIPNKRVKIAPKNNAD